MQSKKIGEIDGPWAITFKINLVLLPALIIGWGIWTTKQIHALEVNQTKIQSMQFTSAEGSILKVEIAKIDTKLTGHVTGHK